MKLNRSLCLWAAAAALSACGPAQRPSAGNGAYVDPLIGTDYHGHVFLGANVPFGGVQLGPTNITEGWDWCSGYHYSDSTLIGFAHTHLSGTGIGDYGDILFLPVSGPRILSRGTLENQDSGYMAKYRHATETARPGYYSVLLDRYGIRAELTAGQRAGYHRYTYPDGTENASVVIDLEDGTGWDAPVEGYLRQVDDRTVEGYRLSTGWAPDQRVYFVARFSQPIREITLSEQDSVVEGTEAKLRRLKAFLDFGDAPEGITLEATVALSAVSIEGAYKNLAAEPQGVSFDERVAQAGDAWNLALDKIRVKGGTEAERRAFYTALYHAQFFPAVFSDADGTYRGADGKIYHDTANTYTVYSLWDTYRAAHPLYTILDPVKAGEFVNDFVKIYEQQGKVPVWHLAGNENNCMVAYQSIPVIADAVLKGIGGFDAEKAYQAAKAYALLNERGVNFIRENEYIPADSLNESVAIALECAIGDWGIAQMARKLGHQEDYEYFLKRSKYYRHYFDPGRQFMRGKLADGTFREPFDPVHSVHRGDDYCEGNAWQYTWLVPQDVEGLVALFGSEEAFATKLDSLFTISSELGEGASSDISGLVGQYAQGNEPNHSTPFLYNFIGQQWKTAALVRHIMKTYFTDAPDGLCGNEDVGQMSAWYVFTSMGLYPANAMSGAFLIASPLFDEANIALPDGKRFRIVTENNSDANIYVQSAELNGKPYTKSYITYKEIMAGGELKLVMGPEPNKAFGAAEADRPKSMVY